MLNRRILRVKAMQALYSYFTTQESLKEVIRGELESQFYPDPAKDDFSEADLFTARRKRAAKLYLENLPNREVIDEEDTDDVIINAVNKSIRKYYTSLRQEEKSIKATMTRDVDNLFRTYLKLVILPVELAHLEKLEQEKREKAHIPKETPWKWHFIHNPVIDDLTKDETLNKSIIDLKVSWNDDLSDLRSWHKDILPKDEVIMAYQHNPNPSVDEHQEAIVHLFKKIVFKSETIDEFLAGEDLHWTENKPILKSLVVKTFQDYEPGLDPPYELKSISKNAEEDLEYFEALFDQTLNKSQSLTETISKRIKNWDISRVALTDLIILKMAITEMMLFPSIPVKVTINEFIEISKVYSTPKSKQFVNGILDVLANELTSEGVIKKSGRGLIDNK